MKLSEGLLDRDSEFWLSSTHKVLTVGLWDSLLGNNDERERLGKGRKERDTLLFLFCFGQKAIQVLAGWFFMQLACACWRVRHHPSRGLWRKLHYVAHDRIFWRFYINVHEGYWFLVFFPFFSFFFCFWRGSTVFGFSIRVMLTS